MKSHLIFGASQGLGDAFARGLPKAGDTMWLVSRSRPSSLELQDGVERIWIPADLSEADAAPIIFGHIQQAQLDVVVYNLGIWEREGFEDHYTFDRDESEHISRMIQTNITSAIVCLQGLLPNLRRADSGKIILIGSTAGLSNANNAQVTFVASKFAIRGIGEALREHLRQDRIAVTCINPGELAAEIPYAEGRERALEAYGGTRIPLQDVIDLASCLIGLSPAACVKEIHLPAMTDTNA
ncbi:SDR family NAD(P)-dependent oxidoreductase [Saccharibacillus brassicae]|uniref:SDR family NAD(P)-dependent oxidoreductase n=1 Tax=Saccharibacillus brassicae TaxID=2583377 RepID=A0A4Y6URI4_SACBS|nr:SDR family NAD(P)-dependent oxidoreductase [Saccharibacillus brassicae]QDH20263.1 SDR family NAD(P)-dependent oxidoreductase [Saccharibacillus brassicae]